MFTGHSICRSGATFFADTGASLLQLKRYGQWKSDRVAESYVENSVPMKMDAANRISGVQNFETDGVKEPDLKRQRVVKNQDVDVLPFHFDNCSFSDCNFNL